MKYIERVMFGLVSGLFVVAGCDEAPSSDDPGVCEDAVAAVEACLGTTPEPSLSPCDEGARATAQELLDGIEGSGCEAVPAGKSDGLFCKDGGWDPLGWCKPAAPLLGPDPQGQPTTYPIILAHGFNTSTTNFWRFNDIDVLLRSDGHVVELGSVPPFDTPKVRAEFLADQVDALLASTGAAKVNLVCFSAGGLDCRYLASEAGLGYGPRIASITTISSPHRGSFVADAATKVLPGTDRARAIDAIASWYGATFSELAADSHLVAALEAMSEAGAVAFNETIVDHPEVFYQSWAAVSSVGGLPHPNPSAESEACRDPRTGEVRMLRNPGTHDRMDVLLVAGAAFVAHGLELRPNDGVATVESSKWGEFRGCVPADHLDLVGQVNDGGPDRGTGFDVQRFYRNLAYDLAARGF